jgi:hypothetical protein
MLNQKSPGCERVKKPANADIPAKASAAAPQDSDRYAGRPIKTSRKVEPSPFRTRPLDID